MHEPTRWRRTQTFARAVGQAAPYVQTAALAGWIATDAFGDEGDFGEYGGFYGGFDAGFDVSGMG